jgi:hypothetical protein
MNIVASFVENSRIDEQLANAREGVYTPRVQGTIRNRIGTLLTIESRTPRFPQLYVFDGEMEPHDTVLWMAWRGKSLQQSSLSYGK